MFCPTHYGLCAEVVSYRQIVRANWESCLMRASIVLIDLPIISTTIDAVVP
jgi:hypothetical protein